MVKVMSVEGALWPSGLNRSLVPKRSTLQILNGTKKFNLLKLQKRVHIVDVEFHPNPNLIFSATKSEPSDKSASHSFGNGYKAAPVN